MIYTVTMGKSSHGKTDRKEVKVEALSATDAMSIAKKQNPGFFVFGVGKPEKT